MNATNGSLVPSVQSSGFDKRASQSQATRRISVNVKEERISTLISAGAEFVGDITLRDGIKIDGHVRGSIRFGLEDGLGIISKNATVQGDFHGPRALIMGTIEGDVYIHGLLMLSPTAIILGNIYYDRLVVHDGAQVSGSMHMNRQDNRLPFKEAQTRDDPVRLRAVG